MASNLFGPGSNHRSADQVRADQDAARAQDRRDNNQAAGQAAGRDKRSI